MNKGKFSCVITGATKKELIASQSKNSVLPGEQYAENARSKINSKIQLKEGERLERERQGKQLDSKHSKSSKKPFVLKVEEDDGEHYYEVLDKICVLNQKGDQKKAFANLLLSKKRIALKFQIDSGSTCSILPLNVDKDISGHNDLKDLNTAFKPVLSLYDEETKIQTLGTRKVFVFNPSNEEEVIIQFRIVERPLTPLIGLNNSEILKLIELLRENIALVGPAKQRVPPTATEVSTPLSMETILTNYPKIFDDSVGKFESTLHLYTRDHVTPHKTAPREIPRFVKNNLIAEVQDLQQQVILEEMTQPNE